MPAKRSVQDVYSNRAFITLTMSAANTLTFGQVQFGVGLFQGVAALIHRIELFPSAASMRELVAVADSMYFAITNRDDLASLDPVNQSVFGALSVLPMMVGGVVSLSLEKLPLVISYVDLPGGALIIPANPLFVGMTSLGFGAAGQVSAVIYLTFKQLTDAEYVELVQTIMPANI